MCVCVCVLINLLILHRRVLLLLLLLPPPSVFRFAWFCVRFGNGSVLFPPLRRRFGKSLMSLGFAPHRSINIIGFNSAEWFIANMGAIAAGGIAAGIYTSNLPEVCVHEVDAFVGGQAGGALPAGGVP